MDFIINIIQNEPVDITYIGIGSASIREFCQENMQQFPPFLQEIFTNNNKTIRLINIDTKFEKDLLLPQFMELDEISTNIDMIKRYQTTNLDCIYIQDTVTDDYSFFDTINKIIMDNNNMLIVGNYTGLSNSLMETYFKNLYLNTIYEYKFLNKITYNFMSDLYGGCMVNMVENFPIIDINAMQLIKISSVNEFNFIELYYCYSDIEHFIPKFKICINSIIDKFMNIDICIYRNYKNKAMTVYALNNLSKSIYRDLSITNVYNDNIFNEINDITVKFFNDIHIILSFLFPENNIINEIKTHIDNFNNDDIYNWSQYFNNLIKNLYNN